MIFQFYHLLPELQETLVGKRPDAAKRPTTAARATRRIAGSHRARAKKRPEMVGLSHRLEASLPVSYRGSMPAGGPWPPPWWPNPDLLWPTRNGTLDEGTGQDIIRILCP